MSQQDSTFQQKPTSTDKPSFWYQWFFHVITKHYVDFQGRASRSEFWYYTLTQFLIVFFFEIISALFYFSHLYYMQAGVIILLYLFDLAVFLPGLGVSVRRLHDTNRSGWFLLLSLLPIIGDIVLIVFFAERPVSQQAGNRYGADL